MGGRQEGLAVHVLAAAAVIAAALGVLYGWHRLSLLLYPNRPCWWCKGTGKMWGSNRRRWGPCWFCKGKAPRRRGARKR